MSVTKGEEHMSEAIETTNGAALWTVAQAAQYSTFTPGTIYKWVRDGVIPVPDVAVRLGGSTQKNKPVRLKVDAFKAWLDAGGEFIAEASKRKEAA